ncbi:Mo-co oxidoreductase dimerisation domain-containing protein [Evansella caseinilytica]|uniref:Mo-co oxidoreductase dimerisation domain-containing protein n=1 Tax=Evansella caseinilytica TaxID=1503961 RepID=A0A1H3NT06_9BACI|nr:sulfite oxidase [Evansella caseinilytica]SDY91565.1 Mo-co oxidoreductase dimerisation domain-containing protein [Evansella caseinilytica]
MNISFPQLFPITRKLHPENQEAPVHFLQNRVTPTDYFFKRNHFAYPQWTTSLFSLIIYGEVHVPLAVAYRQLLFMQVKTLAVVLECAGNQRAFYAPKTYGEQWTNGAVSFGCWTGVPLRDVLQLCGLTAGAKEVVFEGHDVGKHLPSGKQTAYKRSLSLKQALHPDVLIAWQLNGQPLPFAHGGPLRLIVPHWYAMASVKWLKSIAIISGEFQGPFQTEDYVYYPATDSGQQPFPVTTINVNSVIQWPLDFAELKKGVHIIRGIAWTGQGVVTNVELSFNQGKSWTSATLSGFADKPDGYSWKTWSFSWRAEQTGEYTILSRAHDSHGRQQPQEAFWNRKGYGYNAVNKVRVNIV